MKGFESDLDSFVKTYEEPVLAESDDQGKKPAERSANRLTSPESSNDTTPYSIPIHAAGDSLGHSGRPRLLSKIVWRTSNRRIV